ncbi:MAG: FG-GAP repeat protein, partial [Chitinivibrionales bacterium]|nr:FG-GAP repeat protein [Chitinivibrionales bacterium]
MEPTPDPTPTVIPLNRLQQKMIIHASDMQADDNFGYSVSISNNYAIVGSPLEDGISSNNYYISGAAYIFERDISGNWLQKAILHASDTQQYDSFGYSVSISNNYAIIGAPWEDGGVGDPFDSAGAAYIFERDISGNWLQKAILHASDMQSSDHFGYSVSISGDYVIVGAPGEDGGAGNPKVAVGAVYIFERNIAGNWLQKSSFHPSNFIQWTEFGSTVSISNNFAIIGTTENEAYVFERNSSEIWFQKSVLHSSDLQSGDAFGSAVGVFESLIIVGAPKEDGESDDTFYDSGAAYIFERNGMGVWEEKAILHPSSSQQGFHFGQSVSITSSSALIGANGKVFHFTYNTMWEEFDTYIASDIQTGDQFGFSVAIDMNRVIIGAYAEDGGTGNPAVDAGAAYIFE